jgi:tripartite-type tricarboxylate transporter receptor subunit TctC
MDPSPSPEDDLTRPALILLALLAGLAAASAQGAADDVRDYPARVVRLIVTAAPGSAGDTLCRIVGNKLGERLGQQFVIDNRPAAAGTIAAENIARSTPDGYTIGMATTTTHVISTLFNANLPYDPVKDFMPISMIGSSPYVLAIYPGLAASNVADLVAMAKARPGQINNAAFGTTSLGHLSGLLFEHQTGIKLNHVSYRSSAQAVLDVVAGRVEMQFSTLPPAIPLMREGKLRALATTGAKRVSTLPDTPTLAESGLAGFDVALWIGLAAPAGTPRSIVAMLNREITAILNSTEARDALLQQGFVAEPAPPDYLAGRISGDLGKWRDLVAQVGIKAQ